MLNNWRNEKWGDQLEKESWIVWAWALQKLGAWNDKGIFEEAWGDFSPKFMTELKKSDFDNLIYLNFPTCKKNLKTFLDH